MPTSRHIARAETDDMATKEEFDAAAEAIKAVGKKNALEGTIQGNKAQEKIRRMEAESAGWFS